MTTPNPLLQWRKFVRESANNETLTAEVRNATVRLDDTKPVESALANLLEHIADDLTNQYAVEHEYLGATGLAYRVVVSNDDDWRHDWTAALRLARAITAVPAGQLALEVTS